MILLLRHHLCLVRFIATNLPRSSPFISAVGLLFLLRTSRRQTETPHALPPPARSTSHIFRLRENSIPPHFLDTRKRHSSTFSGHVKIAHPDIFWQRVDITRPHFLAACRHNSPTFSGCVKYHIPTFSGNVKTPPFQIFGDRETTTRPTTL